jgi:hypothetical protein
MCIIRQWGLKAAAPEWVPNQKKKRRKKGFTYMGRFFASLSVPPGIDT